MDGLDFSAELTRVVPDTLTGGAIGKGYTLDGIEPLAAVLVKDATDIIAILDFARSYKVPVYPWGAGLQQEIGPLIARPGIVINMANMGRVIDLDPDNLTVTVGAGMKVDELAKVLGPLNLRLPIIPQEPGSYSLGGLAATAASGPDRLKYRTIRDWVLGMQVVVPGRGIIRTGGKTVKNVAGYDMTKLFVGSWGTLGITTQLTLKLIPQAESTVTIVAPFTSWDGAARWVQALLNSPLPPVAIDVADALAAADAGLEEQTGIDVRQLGLVGLMLVKFEGFREDLKRRQAETIKFFAFEQDEIVGYNAYESTYEGETGRVLWEKLGGLLKIRRGHYPSMVRLKLSVPITALSELARLISFEQGRYRGINLSLTGHAGNGIYYLYILPDLNVSADSLRDYILNWKRLADGLGGFALVEWAPPNVKVNMSWVPPRPDYRLMKQIKEVFDPDHLLNPHREIGV